MNALWPTYLSDDLLLGGEERQAIHRDAWRLWAKSRWNLALYMVLPVVFVSLVPLAAKCGGAIASFFGLGAGAHRALIFLTPLAWFTICFALGGAILQRIRFAPCVFRAARERGHDVCFKCGYWLHRLPHHVHRCPECGTAREGHTVEEARENGKLATQPARRASTARAKKRTAMPCPNCGSTDDVRVVWGPRNVKVAAVNALQTYFWFGFWPFVSLREITAKQRPLRRKCFQCGHTFIGNVPEAPDFDACAVCSYSLKGNVSGRCPECGWKLPRRYRAYRRLADRALRHCGRSGFELSKRDLM